MIQDSLQFDTVIPGEFSDSTIDLLIQQLRDVWPDLFVEKILDLNATVDEWLCYRNNDIFQRILKDGVTDKLGPDLIHIILRDKELTFVHNNTNIINGFDFSI